mmetsp:Transcript_10550/g.25772  ORF Transcript_10550/g.25772 Transcript_10550/m.25772 type:complete len:275 (+) Transcript_10550:1523-2347(+)
MRRWPICVNERLQTLHRNGFSPLWMRRCWARLSCWWNVRLHTGHWCGLQPACVRTCLDRELSPCGPVNFLPQIVHVRLASTETHRSSLMSLFASSGSFLNFGDRGPGPGTVGRVGLRRTFSSSSWTFPRPPRLPAGLFGASKRLLASSSFAPADAFGLGAINEAASREAEWIARERGLNVGAKRKTSSPPLGHACLGLWQSLQQRPVRPPVNDVRRPMNRRRPGPSFGEAEKARARDEEGEEAVLVGEGRGSIARTQRRRAQEVRSPSPPPTNV